jgi:GST-like protein
MIELYTHATPNGHKVSIMLEEVGLPYRLQIVDIQKNQQFDPKFLAINPNNKIPAIVDPDGPDGKPLTVFESGAILVYLAEKTRSNLLPPAGAQRYKVIQWLMFQMAGVGPMFGQAGHFAIYAKEKVQYGIDRYTNEAKRLLGVMDRELAQRQYIAGPDYSIADIAIYPWTNSVLRVPTVGNFDAWPNIAAWRERIGARPAVQRGLLQPKREN